MAEANLNSVVSHWSTLIEGFQASPLSFYQSVESALARREVPQTANSRVDHKEAGLLSAKREYLRFKREKLIFDICAAPFGTAFFVSWWLTEDLPRLNAIVKVVFLAGLFLSFGLFATVFTPFVGPFLYLGVLVGAFACVQALADSGQMNDSFVRALPLVGRLYVWLFKPATFYRIDTMEMFQRAVHNAVLEVIDAMTAEKGLKLLSESERKPIMRELYSRKGV